MANDEVYDVLSLASSLNQDIHELNRNAIPGSKLGMDVINPQKIIGNLPLPQIPQRPPQMNIEGLSVSGPTPLIPLTDIYPDGNIPAHLLTPPPLPPPIPQQVAGMPISKPVTVPVQPLPQMEFNFVDQLLNSQTFQGYIDEKFLKIEIKINKIYSLLKEILEKKQKRRKTSNKPIEQPVKPILPPNQIIAEGSDEPESE